MDPNSFDKINDYLWEIPQQGEMRVPGRIFASEKLIQEMDEKVREQVMNVAMLPGIQIASMAMPDAHWGYGFPIGGVAAFDPDEGGIISMGGVGFDISCGVRTMKTGLTRDEVMPGLQRLADQFYTRVPAGVGSEGLIKMLSKKGTESKMILTISKNRAGWRALIPMQFPKRPRSASIARWARSVQATITSKHKLWRIFMTNQQRWQWGSGRTMY
jgi:hypothetical protein